MNLRSATARRREWATQTRMALAFERGLTGKLRREFRSVAKRAKVQWLHGNHVDIETSHKHRLLAILKPYLHAVIHTFGRRTSEAIAGVGKAAITAIQVKMTEAELNIFSNDYIDEWVPTRVTDIAATTAKRIANTIKKGLADNLTNQEIADNIVTDTGGDIGDARAATIARTEIHSAANAGSVATAEEMQIPGLVKQWLTIGDQRVRDDHAAAEGQQAALDEAFDVGGEAMMFPGDPNGSAAMTVNCRCALTYVVNEELS